MGLDPSTDVAFTALTVSLIALIIAIWQMLQQYFGTADGFRNCQSSVIGPWSVWTRTRFRWSELRFETKFTTPEIRLLTGTDIQWERLRLLGERGSAGALAESRDDAVRQRSIEDRLLRRTQWSWKRWAYVRAGVQPFELTSTDPEVPDALRETLSRAVEDDPSEVLAKIVNIIRRKLKDPEAQPDTSWTLNKMARRMQHRKKGSDFVSWTELLRSLHRLEQAIYKDQKGLQGRSEYAHITVNINEWSWDLVPPQIFRPYATSTVGTIVCLAHRLGMQWTSLNPGKGEMSAEGNGHSISSTTVHGFGIVLQYTQNIRFDAKEVRPTIPKEIRRIIPTHAADKLGCGIIPSSEDNNFDPGEYWLITSNGEYGSLGNILETLDVDKRWQNALTTPKEQATWAYGDSNTRHVVNDMVCLMCPFLPARDDWRCRIIWPLQTRIFSSPLIYWEGRKALITHLQNQIGNSTSDSGDLRHKAKSYLEELEAHFPGNFYCDWDNAVRAGDEERMYAFLRRLREIFDATTFTFRTRQWPPNSMEKLDTTAVLSYTDLVGAHLTMAASVGQEARSGGVMEGSADDSLARITMPRSTTGWVPYIYRIADLYVENLDRVTKHLHDRGYQRVPRAEIEGLWWMLMVRGICWAMSVDICRPGEQDRVASYLYYSSTPVYIV